MNNPNKKSAISDYVSREQLLESFKSLQSQFDSSLARAREHERGFEDLRLNFMRRLSEHLTVARNDLPENSPLRQQVLGFIKVMEKTRIEWDAKVAGREKGVKFREGFEDSLLVFINGKVKSGKSSLGNYLAWGHTDPSDELKLHAPLHLVPSYFSHEKNDVEGGDTDNEAQRRREFRVGATEATSSIQGFRLPGLTWVDSPGLHSVKKENERLARDYVEHADLILYTMKSDSPGRDSDLKEVKQLLGKDKKVLLLLTGSDDVEEDYNEEKDCLEQTVVMKDAERRAKQHAYVREALEGNCASDLVASIEIVSISARYAQLNANNQVAFSESGMGLLCETLHRVAQSDGVRLKQRTPILNMRNFLQGCHNDLTPYSELLLSFKQPLEELKRQSYNKLNVHIRSGQNELSSHIDDFFERLASRRNNQSEVGKQLTTFQKSLNDKFQELASVRLAQIFEDLMAGFQSAVANTYNNSELLKLPDFKLEQVEEQIPVTRSGTKKRNSLLGSLIGGVIGAVVGGPAGAALGASLGGGLGGVTGDSAAVDYRSEIVTVGDNLQEIRQQAIRTSQILFEEQIRQAADLLWSSLERDVEQLLCNLNQEISEFANQLDQMLQITRVE